MTAIFSGTPNIHHFEAVSYLVYSNICNIMTTVWRRPQISTNLKGKYVKRPANVTTIAACGSHREPHIPMAKLPWLLLSEAIPRMPPPTWENVNSASSQLVTRIALVWASEATPTNWQRQHVPCCPNQCNAQMQTWVLRLRAKANTNSLRMFFSTLLHYVLLAL